MTKNDILGYCVCTKCDFSIPACINVDCGLIKCPKCHSPMRAGGQESDTLNN